MRRRLLIGLCAVVATVSCGLGSADVEVSEQDPAAAGAGDAAGPGKAPSAPLATDLPISATTTTSVPSPYPPLPDDGRPRAVLTPTGVVVPVLEAEDGLYLVKTPCQNEVLIAEGEPLTGAHVVIDPGHGGDEEPGAVGPNGLTEAELNLAVSLALRDELVARGMTAVLTRETDFRLPIITRAEIPTVLEAHLFVSVHHNAGVSDAHVGPGSEFYFQAESPESRRMAGIMWETVYDALASYDVGWVGMSDAGAIYRTDREGLDYYGVLRRPVGVPSVLAELAYLSNGPEAELLATPEFQAVEARAMADAIERWFTTDDAGSGYNDPIFRGYGPSGAGRLEGCVDPPLT